MHAMATYLRICQQVVEDTKLMLRCEHQSQNSWQGPKMLHVCILVDLFSRVECLDKKPAFRMKLGAQG